MATLVQICASRNDLFALDGDGVVYHYNFNTNAWMKLGRGRPGQGASPGGHDPDAVSDGLAHRLAATDAGALDAGART